MIFLKTIFQWSWNLPWKHLIIILFFWLLNLCLKKSLKKNNLSFENINTYKLSKKQNLHLPAKIVLVFVEISETLKTIAKVSIVKREYIYQMLILLFQRDFCCEPREVGWFCTLCTVLLAYLCVAPMIAWLKRVDLETVDLETVVLYLDIVERCSCLNSQHLFAIYIFWTVASVQRMLYRNNPIDFFL